jgi:glycosyltransferase involved in cell wall biosynthesis
MKIVLSHPTGNANVRAAAIGMMKANLLAHFRTSIAAFPGDFVDNLGAFRPLSEIRRRRFDPILKPITLTSPSYELGRLIASKMGVQRLIKHETGVFSIDSIYQNFDRKVAASLEKLSKKGVDAVYAYEDGAVFSFRKARNIGLNCFYDLPIGYWRTAKELLEIEKKRWPEWTETLTGFLDSNEKLLRKDEELSLADQIFVASKFTASTLSRFPAALAEVKVIPYGFPPVVEERNYTHLSTKKPLKLLFVGSLSQRKGIADLFSAVEAIGSHVQLTVVGAKVTDNCDALNKALVKHRWIESLSHSQILQLMREHDVLIFPSLFEGFGLVITEAMSQGTPVLTTDRTAGPDLINNGENGWLINGTDIQNLQARIEELLYKPKLIEEVGKAAMETAKKRPWSQYGLELAEALTAHPRP